MSSSIPASSELQEAIEKADGFRGQGTKYLHLVGEEESNPYGAVVTPISLATTFKQGRPGVPACVDDPNSFGLGFEYSRTGNPTRGAFERAVAQAEQARYCVSFSSGSAATSAVVHLLKHGDKILCIDDVYGGTQRYFRRIVQPTMDIAVDFCDLNNEFTVDESTKLIWLETPTNPTLKVTDISAVAKKKGQALLAVDNTFMSPYFQNPLTLGADVVVHSVTKYIGGHSDVVMGLVCTNEEDIFRKLKFISNGVGAVPSPFDCFLAHRGLKTLHLRMEAASRNAQAIALFLEDHPMVRKVAYPGLVSHPQHELAKRQQHGFGAMITFYCKGGRNEADKILSSLKVFTLAESLGAVGKYFIQRREPWIVVTFSCISFRVSGRKSRLDDARFRSR